MHGAYTYASPNHPFPLHTQPKVVTDVDEEELRKQMEELQLANQEVAGDDDASDNEAGAENGDD